MKRVVLFALAFGVLFSLQDLHAQARKIVLFEHFTNASCGPCASQNPVFEQNIRDKNKGNYIHVAYHTVWPGRDPMNAYNKDDVAARVTYYNVTGVPDMVMLGNQYNGGPSGVSQEILDRASAQSSPLRIRVQESSNGTQRTVHATLTSAGVVPSAGLRVRALTIESDISFATAPGSNGEKEFPNVFRRFLNTPNGEDFAPAALGESVDLYWTYDLEPAEWDTTKIYAVVFVQLESTKEVINAGARFLPDVELVAEDDQFKKGMPQQQTSFSGRIINFGEAEAHVRLALTSAQPNDWTAEYTVDGTVASGATDVTVPANGSIPVAVNYSVGGTAGIAEGMLGMASLDDAELTSQYFGTGVISNVTDLVVNNDNSWGSDDGTKSSDFQEAYLAGITLAGSSTHAVTALSTFMRAFNAKMLDDVDHIYYNAGWAFPALPDDFSRAMIGFLGEGGNLLVAGQDVGWDVTDPNGHGTSTARAFYRTYLFANYTADGGPTNAALTFMAEDLLFGGVAKSALVNVYGSNTQGTPYFYPDQIRPSPDGVSVSYYNDDPTLISGIRGAKNNYKTVYFGFGLEQVSDESVRNEIMKLTWQWFHGIITAVEFDAAVASLSIGQNYPNPVSMETVIPITPAARERTLRVYDITGRLVMTHSVAPAASRLQLSTAALHPGMYFYQLFDGTALVGSRTMQVLR
ncbi:MAG: T9SS type A sorting domain-containing protein [Bacteroidetes bacterium]|nr:T9SS type A sorting domain-containing protein [Bacteroidota bacterium]